MTYSSIPQLLKCDLLRETTTVLKLTARIKACSGNDVLNHDLGYEIYRLWVRWDMLSDNPRIRRGAELAYQNLKTEILHALRRYEHAMAPHMAGNWDWLEYARTCHSKVTLKRTLQAAT